MQASIRKAAILVTALDSASAQAMLAQLGPKTAARIHDAVRQLGRVDPVEQQAVLAEFFAQRESGADSEALSGPAERLAAAGRDEVVLGHTELPPSPRRPFQFLEAVNPAQLAERVLHEHPQTIAIVAAHAPRSLAAELLWRLPESLRTEVLIRVIEWQGTDAQLLSELEQALEMSLVGADAVAPGVAGLAAAREILQAAPSDERLELLEGLQRRDGAKAALLNVAFDAPRTTSVGEGQDDTRKQSRDPAPMGESWNAADTGQPDQEPPPLRLNVYAPPSTDEAEQPTPEREKSEPGFDFAEFVRLDDRTLSRVLSAAAPQTTLLALTGASPQLMARVLRRLSRKEATQLQRRMAAQGPFRLRDIELAQRELAAVAARLAAEGKIRLPNRRRAA